MLDSFEILTGQALPERNLIHRYRENPKEVLKRIDEYRLGATGIDFHNVHPGIRLRGSSEKIVKSEFKFSNDMDVPLEAPYHLIAFNII